MSLIKANAVQVGQSPTATQNFTLAVPSSPDGTIKLARGNAGATTQDVLNVNSFGNITKNSSDNWSVNGTDRELHDAILVKRIFNGESNTSGYFSAGSGVYSYQGYGQTKASLGQKASGTTNCLTGHINVWAAGNGSGTGRTEIVPIAGAAVLQRDNIQSGINIYNEFSVIGPKSSNASDREGFLSGMTSLVMKFCPGNTIDSAHSGSYGATITTRPGEPGFGFESRSGDTTYPLRAGLAINGWSGLLSTANTGYSAAATDGYEYGILIGGVAGSVWLDATVRSRIGTGVGITDYINYAVDIFTKHPEAVSNSGAIRIAADAGVSLFGLSTQLDSEARIQTVVSTQFGSAIRIGPSTHVTSERAGMQFGDWTLGQDGAGNGTKDFSFYDGTTQRIIISAAGATNIITLPNLPTSSAGLTTGKLWRDAASGNVVKIIP